MASKLQLWTAFKAQLCRCSGGGGGGALVSECCKIWISSKCKALLCSKSNMITNHKLFIRGTLLQIRFISFTIVRSMISAQLIASFYASKHLTIWTLKSPFGFLGFSCWYLFRGFLNWWWFLFSYRMKIGISNYHF